MKNGYLKFLPRVLCLFLAALLLVSCGSGIIDESEDGASSAPEASTVDNLSDKKGFDLVGDAYVSDGLAKNLPTPLRKVGVTAAKAEGKLIAADESFIIQTDGDISANELTQYVTLSPAVGYTVAKLSANKFELTPAVNLASGKVYRLLVGDRDNPAYSFAFQTEAALTIKSVLPADEAFNVPVNAGIEIEFSDSVYGNDFGKYITVSPAVDGYFALYPDGKTVAFVPNRGLDANKIYIVTVGKGITCASGKTLEEERVFAFRTAPKKTENTQSAYFRMSSVDYTFRPGDYPVLYYYANNIQHTITADIYKYASVGEAVQAKKDYEAVGADYYFSGKTYLYPTDGLTKVTTFNKKVQNEDTFNNYLELPQLGGGIYLVNLTFDCVIKGEKQTCVKQALVQVTDLTIYTEGCEGSLLVWVNGSDGVVKDAAVKGECYSRRNFRISGNGGITFAKTESKTNADGICFMDNGKDDSVYLTVKSGADEAYACVYSGPKTESDRYFSYVYTDREVYFADDTVNFAGTIRPAASYTEIPEKLYLKTSWSGSAYEEIQVNVDGTFNGSLEIEGYSNRWIYLRFCDADGKLLFSKNITVTDQDKPVYKASLAFDKPFYSFGDTVTVTLTATFFDGTPAPYLTFDFCAVDFLNSKTLKTGADGTAVCSFKTYSKYTYSTYPFNIVVWAQLIGEETTSLYVSKSVMYFNTDIYFTSRRVDFNHSEIYLNKVDTSRITCAEDATYENSIGGPAEGGAVVNLIKCEFKKKYTGTTYDPITKKSVENYNYYTEKTVVKSYYAQFKDGVISLDHIQTEKGFEGYYMYEVTYHGAANGFDYTQSVYACKGEERDNNYYNYNGAPYYVLKTDGTEFSVGDEVGAWVEYGDKKYDGKVLYTVYSEGRFSYTLANEYSFRFDDSFVAGAALYATIFDREKGIITPWSVSLAYDYEANSSLNITVETDKDAYKPGETVTAKIKASSLIGTAADATIILSVADEACFALGEQTVNALMSYYQSGFYGGINRNTRLSDIYYYKNIRNVYLGYGNDVDYAEEKDLTPAESGDAEEDGSNSQSARIREIFEDNPVFIVCSLDYNGEAVVTFTMPDNITEWRVTAVALNVRDAGKFSGTEVGNCVSDVICTLPYFINVSSNTRYITGDDISVSARSYGSSLTSVKPVTYSALLYDDEGALVALFNVKENSDRYARFNFGKLEKGSYAVQITGDVGGYGDAVKKFFTVTETGVLMNVTKDISVDEIASLEAQAYPVNLSFHDDTYDELINVARRLMWGYSERSDTLASNFVGAAALQKLFGWDYSESNAKTKLSSYTGFIPLVSYGEGNAELTAKICAVAPETLTVTKKAELAERFADYISKAEYKDDVGLCAALLGLASLGSPVLTDLTYVAAHCEDFSAEAKLYLCAAFGYLGDFSAAKEIYNALREKYAAEADGGELYFNGGDTEKSIKLTSLALLSASLVSKLDAEKLAAYLMERTSYIDQYLLELASYVRYFMPTEIKTSSFTYKIGENEEKEITLKAGSVYILSLTKKEFKSFAVVSSDEAVSVRANYMGTAEEAVGGKAESAELSIDKTIEPYDLERGLYIVKINYSGKTDRNYAYYTLADCIPSGARYFSSDGGYSNNNAKDYNAYAWLSNSAQMMNGGISVYRYNSDPMKGNTVCRFSGQISYIIRAAVQGEFVIEAAVAVDTNNKTFAVSQRGRAVIQSAKWLIYKD